MKPFLFVNFQSPNYVTLFTDHLHPILFKINWEHNSFLDFEIFSFNLVCILDDHQIDHDEFLKAMPELRRDHVFGHCKKICICYRYICYCLRPAKQAPKVVFKG